MPKKPAARGNPAPTRYTRCCLHRLDGSSKTPEHPPCARSPARCHFSPDLLPGHFDRFRVRRSRSADQVVVKVLSMVSFRETLQPLGQPPVDRHQVSVGGVRPFGALGTSAASSAPFTFLMPSSWSVRLTLSSG